MILNLNLGYIVRDGDREANGFKHDRNISDFLIRQSVSAHYVQGMKQRTDQRNYKSVLNALTKALKDDKDTIELSAAEARWVYEASKDWDLRVVGADGQPRTQTFLSGWFFDWIEYLDKAVKDSDKAPEEPKKP